MDSTKLIQVAVARADLIICNVMRWAAIIVPLTIVLLLCVLAFHRAMWNDHFHWQDPYWIDYDAPGVDITSEGPEAYTEEYYRIGGEDR